MVYQISSSPLGHKSSVPMWFASFYGVCLPHNKHLLQRVLCLSAWSSCSLHVCHQTKLNFRFIWHFFVFYWESGLQIMDTRSLAVSMNTNFASFDLSRHLSPLRSAKLSPRSIPRASASISTTNSDSSPSGNAINSEAISVKPVYVPTPPNRELRTPHSG